MWRLLIFFFFTVKKDRGATLMEKRKRESRKKHTVGRRNNNSVPFHLELIISHTPWTTQYETERKPENDQSCGLYIIGEPYVNRFHLSSYSGAKTFRTMIYENERKFRHDRSWELRRVTVLNGFHITACIGWGGIHFLDCLTVYLSLSCLSVCLWMVG